MCIEVFNNHSIRWQPGDTAYNFMVLWNQIVFPVATIIMGIILLIDSGRKVRLYKKRFDSFYARDLSMPNLNIRDIVVVTWMFLPFIMLTIFFIAFRPFYYKYWIIACAVLLTVIQYLTGRFAYRYDIDARALAEYVKNKNA